MTAPSTGSLASLLRILASSSSPEKVLDAVAHGPLAGYGVVGSAILVADGDDLVMVGDALIGPIGWHDSLRVMPRTFHDDIVAAGRTHPAVLSGWAQTYATLNPDLWRLLVERTAEGRLTHLDLVHDHAVVGSLGVITAEPARLDPVLAEALSAALGLWITAASTDAAELVRAVRQRVRPALSADDVAILRLVAAGLGTAQIARQLHLSPSTVKNRIAHATRALNATTRHDAVASARRIGALDG
jgi:DNA-binding CsgD family transcriptional regulator